MAPDKLAISSEFVPPVHKILGALNHIPHIPHFTLPLNHIPTGSNQKTPSISNGTLFVPLFGIYKLLGERKFALQFLSLAAQQDLKCTQKN